MKKTTLTPYMMVATAALAVSLQAHADKGSNTGPYAFEPLLNKQTVQSGILLHRGTYQKDFHSL